MANLTQALVGVTNYTVGTVTSVATGAGLTGGTITGTGTLKAALKSETKSTLEADAMGSTASRQYAVGLDKNGVLSVNVPWNVQMLESTIASGGGKVEVYGVGLFVAIYNSPNAANEECVMYFSNKGHYTTIHLNSWCTISVPSGSTTITVTNNRTSYGMYCYFICQPGGSLTRVS